MKKKGVVVLGMHRSGTSTLTAAVHACGFALGNVKVITDDDNPKGYFENFDVVRLNEKIFREAETSWDLPGFPPSADMQAIEERNRQAASDLLKRYYSDERLWVLKDPRMCMLLRFWVPIIESCDLGEVYYVLSVRHPIEVAQSQARRHRNNPDFHVLGSDERYTLVLWYEYYRRAIQAIRSPNVIIVDYNKLISQPLPEISRISNFVGETPRKEKLRWYEDEFIDVGLRRNSIDDSKQVEFPVGYDFVSHLYNHLLAYSHAPSVSVDVLRGIFELKENGGHDSLIDGLIGAMIEPGKQLYKLRREIAARDITIRKLERSLKEIKKTLDWHLAAPFREITRFVRAHFDKHSLGVDTQAHGIESTSRAAAVETETRTRGGGDSTQQTMEAQDQSR